MCMETAYSVTNNHGIKEIVKTHQQIEYLNQEDFEAIIIMYKLRNNRRWGLEITDCEGILRETEKFQETVKNNRNKQALMLKTIADEIDKERNAYTPTADYETWSSNPDAVAEFVNTLKWRKAIDLSASTWTEVSTQYFQFAVHNKQLSKHVTAFEFK